MKFRRESVICWLSLCAAASAEIEGEIPLGIEAVTGIRSGYVHRGFELAETSLEFQFAGLVTLSKNHSLNFGLSHLAESSGDYSESTGYLELEHRWSDQFRTGISATYRNRTRGILDSGMDLGVYSSFAINDDWEWRNEINWDFGPDGLYVASELTWSHPLSEKTFISASGGVSILADYADRDGLNDLFTRLSLNYAFSKQVAFTPFLGASIQLDDDSPGDDVFYGGLWFQVIF